jgi:hypothetical protein
MILPSEMFADGFQFPQAFRGGFGICHFKFIERVKDNLRNDDPGILLVIGANDVPGRVMGARRGQAGPISLHIMPPEFSLVNIRKTEFPVFVRLVDAFEESPSLFVLR